MDPRVKVPALDLQKQFVLEVKLLEALQRGDQALANIRGVRATKQALTPEFEAAISEIEPAGAGSRHTRGKTSLSAVNGALLQLSVGISTADAAPTLQQTAAAQKALTQLEALLKQWEALKSKIAAPAK